MSMLKFLLTAYLSSFEIKYKYLVKSPSLPEAQKSEGNLCSGEVYFYQIGYEHLLDTQNIVGCNLRTLPQD